MNTQLSSIEINPQTPPVGSVILLHGLGADGNDFVPIVSELKLTLPIRFVFPHAPMLPVTINNGYVMRAWYDIHSLTIERHADQYGIESSVKKIRELIEHEVSLGIPADKIILAGFSQGAVIALTTGLTYPERLGGIIALSGYLPYANEVLRQVTTNKITPIFLGHGTGDNIVPLPLGEGAFDFLKKNQCLAEWHTYRMAHSVCEEELLDITRFLNKIYS